MVPDECIVVLWRSVAVTGLRGRRSDAVRLERREKADVLGFLVARSVLDAEP